MANRKLSERQLIKIDSERRQHVYKRDNMIQKGRHNLSLQEQRCVLYAISKIRPDDSVFKEYTLELSEFFKICGLGEKRYTELKAILKKLSDKSWWIEIDDKGAESLVRWFSTLVIHKKSGKVVIKFHEHMMPYLLKLVEQGEFYTHYELKYILPMKSQYAIRLYELLKSYQKNNYSWFFEIDELKKRLNCEKYVDFAQFKRRVIEPAVKEINEFTDIKIDWDTEKEGRKVTRVNFYMLKKKKHELRDVNSVINEKLNGPTDWDNVTQEARNSVRYHFFEENRKKSEDN